MPDRIQLQRHAGWRKPENAIVVARPTIWGNPWRVIPAPPPQQVGANWTVDGPGGFFCWTEEKYEANDFAVHLYREWLDMGNQARALMVLTKGETRKGRDELEHRRNRILGQLRTLAGRDLACWCPLDGYQCHADVLLQLASEVAA